MVWRDVAKWFVGTLISSNPVNPLRSSPPDSLTPFGGDDVVENEPWETWEEVLVKILTLASVGLVDDEDD